MKRSEHGETARSTRRTRSRAATMLWAVLGTLSLTAFAGITEGRPASAAEATECTVPEVSVLWAWSGGEPPPVRAPEPGWHTIAHPTNALISFVAPADWSPSVLALPPSIAGTQGQYNWAGLRGTSGDNTTAVEVGTTPVAGIQDDAAAAAFGLSNLFPGRQPNILCAGDFAASSSSVIVAELGGTIAYVAGYATPHEQLDQTVFVYYTAAAPAVTFTAATQDAFIAIFYQFYG